MAAKVTTISLVSAAGERIFSIDIAEELLSWPKSGWMLPNGSEYEYKDGRLVRKREAETKAIKKEK